MSNLIDYFGLGCYLNQSTNCPQKLKNFSRIEKMDFFDQLESDLQIEEVFENKTRSNKFSSTSNNTIPNNTSQNAGKNPSGSTPGKQCRFRECCRFRRSGECSFYHGNGTKYEQNCSCKDPDCLYTHLDRRRIKPQNGVTAPRPFNGPRPFQCKGCKTNDHPYRFCPHNQCNICRERGHISSVCPKKNRSDIENMILPTEDFFSAQNNIGHSPGPPPLSDFVEKPYEERLHMKRQFIKEEERERMNEEETYYHYG